MTSKTEFDPAFQGILEDLREAVDASRTTLRIDIDAWGVNVDTPVAESTAPGVASIRGASLDQRSLPTVQLLDRERQPLIHNDCELADPPPPKALIDVYGVKAQMLAPLVRNERLVGWISVHYTPSPREWSSGDVEALKRAATRVHEVLLEIESTS